MRYRDIDRGMGNLAIIAAPRDRTISCMKASCMPAQQLTPKSQGDNYRIITPHCLICTLSTHIFPIQADSDDDGSGGGGGSFVGGQQCQHPMSFPRPAHVSVVSCQQRCADCKSLIRVSPQSSTKDPCRLINSFFSIFCISCVLTTFH